MNGLKIMFVLCGCLAIAFGLGTLTSGMSSETTVALPSNPPSVIEPQPQPAKATEQPTVTGSGTLPEDGEQFQDVVTNEVEYVRECERDVYGNVVSCRVVPRVRQVTRRVAVNTAKVATRAVANIAATVAEVATPVRVSSGGSTGTYSSHYTTSAYNDRVVYGSTGSAYVTTSGTHYHVRTRPVLFDGPIARMLRRR